MARKPTTDKPTKPAKVKAPSQRKGSRGRQEDGAPNLIDIHVGSRIRLRRVLLGMSQERLGDALGITFQQVQKYERGANRVGSSRLFDLSQILDVPVAFFFDDMSDEAKANSPAAHVGGLNVGSNNDEASLMERAETLGLVKAYYSIPDEKVRAQVYQLAKTLASVDEG